MDVKNIRVNNRGTIDCELNVNDEWMPFTASPDDPEEHGRIIYAELKECLEVKKLDNIL